jgi:threonylcarbamoyladenosine tRNA methylthiotransferase MtaB
MRRPYTAEDFKETVLNIRNKVPEIAITTDIIVGFPGETEADFNQTVEFVKELAFSKIHVFPFSAREGTPAADMKNKVNGNIIKEFSKKLRNINDQLMLNYQQKFIGDSKKVLIEEERDHNTGMLTGYTDNYLKVLTQGSDKYQNRLVEVKLKKTIDAEHIEGIIIK